MNVWKAVVALPAMSGVPKDVSENTLFFRWPPGGGGPSDGDFTTLKDALAAFYNETSSGAIARLSAYMAPSLDNGVNHASVSFYNVPDAPGPLGPPVSIKHWTFAGGGTTHVPLPLQIAVVGSFHADLTAIAEHGPGTRPRARRRGRIYLGPLNGAALEEDAGAFAPQTVNSQLITDLNQSMLALEQITDSTSWSWVVFSRVNWSAQPVIGGWVDDRFDTQRRRLEEADSRLTWSA